MATAQCPCCGRNVDQLHRVQWKDGGEKKHDWTCYACKYNTFPPGHDLFEVVQTWRGARGMSVRIADAAKAAQYERAKSEGELAPPEWARANDERILEAARRELRTGQVATSVVGSRCVGPGCANLIQDPAIVVYPEGKKRRATWLACSQACLDAWHREAARGARPPMHELKDARGGLRGYIVPGKGFRSLADLGEPEFCPGCDKLVEVCECAGGGGAS